MMKLLRQFEPIKSFEYNLTPLERIEVKRKKREKNANTIENRLKKIRKKK